MSRPRLPALDDVPLEGKRVLVRADLNVPLGADGAVTDDFRVRAFLPTLRRVLERGGRAVVCAHLGRPKGRPDDRYRMRPVAEVLSGLLGATVTAVPEVVGPAAASAAEALRPGEAALLENLRFEPGERSNDPSFADALADLGDVYVNDAFGACHRAHASIVGVPERLPAAAGLLLAAEVENLTRLLEAPDRPYVVVLGGVKVTDKIGVVRNLLDRADRILIGGGMCFTFLKANGAEVGRSVVDEENLDAVSELLDEPGADRLVLPTDVVAADAIDAETGQRVGADRIPADLMGVDVGVESARGFASQILSARTVFWNGPMGVFENEPFAEGTKFVAEAVARCEGYTVTGGGDTAAALAAFGLTDDVDFMSTGGGASLELLEGTTLPGIDALVRASAGRTRGPTDMQEDA